MSRQRKKKRSELLPKQESVEDLMKRGAYDQASEILRGRLARGQSDDDLRLLAECLAGKKDYPGALEIMRSLKTRAPRDVLYEGWLYFDAENTDKARERFGEYIALKPESPHGHYCLACTFDHWRLHDEASKAAVIENLRRAIACKECFAEAYTLLAARLPWDDEGRKQKLSVLRAALERHPDSQEVRLDLGWLCIENLGMDKDGLDVVKPLLELSPPPPQALWRAYKACQHLKKPQDALKYLHAIPTEHLDGSDRGVLVGACQLLAEDFAAALKAFSGALTDVKPTKRLFVLFARADTFLRMGQPGPALDDARNAAFAVLESEAEPWEEGIWVGREPEALDAQATVQRVCRAFLDNDNPFTRDSVDQPLRGALSYILFVLEEGVDDSKAEPLLHQAAGCLEHPVISGKLAHRCLRDGKFEDALRHHLVYCRWKYRRAGQNRPELDLLRDCRALMYLEEDEWPSKKAECKQILRTYCAELATCSDPSEVRTVFVPTYTSFVGECLRRKEMYADLAKPAKAILAYDRSDPQVLWDWAYANHCGEEWQLAEAAYRELLQASATDSSAMHNLSLIVARRGDQKSREEAYALSEKAASLSPKDQIVAKRHAQLKSQREADERERQKREDFLKTAPLRWPKLDYYKRQLACTLSLITGWESLDDLSRLSGIEEKFLQGHLRALEEDGILIWTDPSKFHINPHIRPLIELEKTHAVVTKLIHGDESIAFKPIFNSKQEYTVYGILVTLFPNHLVFPNMALQTIFQYERVQKLLKDDQFSFYLRSQVDFCVTSTASYLPLIAIEVDSRFHDDEDQKARDAKKDRIFEVGGVSLVRIRAYGKPTPTAMRNQIIDKVKLLGDKIRQSPDRSAILTCLEREIDFDTFGAESEGRAGPRWLTVSQAASVAGVNAGVITRDVDSGDLMGNGLTGRERRVDAVDLAQWMLRRAGRPEPQESDAQVEGLVRKHVTS